MLLYKKQTYQIGWKAKYMLPLQENFWHLATFFIFEILFMHENVFCISKTRERPFEVCKDSQDGIWTPPTNAMS